MSRPSVRQLIRDILAEYETRLVARAPDNLQRPIGSSFLAVATRHGMRPGQLRDRVNKWGRWEEAWHRHQMGFPLFPTREQICAEYDTYIERRGGPTKRTEIRNFAAYAGVPTQSVYRALERRKKETTAGSEK